MGSSGWRQTALLVLIGQCITLFGSTLVQMALVWYVTLRTGSGIWIGALTLCAYLPQFFLSPVGGAWADRRPLKPFIAGADAGIAAVTLALIPILPILSDGHLPAALLILSALRSAGAGIQTPAVDALLPRLIPPALRQRWNGGYAAMQALVRFAAPAAAGVLMALLPLSAVLLIDVLTAIAGIALLLPLSLPGPQPETEPSGIHTAPGLFSCLHRVFVCAPAIGGLLTLYILFVFFTVPAGYLSGLLVTRRYGGSYLSLTAVELAGFAGMTAGGLLAGLGRRWRSHTVLTAGLACFGLLSAVLGLPLPFSLYLAAMACYGIALTTVQTTLTTLLQAHAPLGVQGRVFGLVSGGYALALPLGMALFGFLADQVALPWLMAAAGAGLLVLSVWTGLRPSLSKAQPPP